MEQPFFTTPVPRASYQAVNLSTLVASQRHFLFVPCALPKDGKVSGLGRKKKLTAFYEPQTPNQPDMYLIRSDLASADHVFVRHTYTAYTASLTHQQS